MTNEDMTNLERLERDGFIKPGTRLTQQQKDALEGLSHKDLDKLDSVKRNLGTGFIPINGLMGTKPKARP